MWAMWTMWLELIRLRDPRSCGREFVGQMGNVDHAVFFALPPLSRWRHHATPGLAARAHVAKPLYTYTVYFYLILY